MLVYQRVVIYIPSFCNHFSPTPGSSYETHADPTLMLLTVKAYGTPGTTRPRSRPRARRPWREKWHAVIDITACGHDQINLYINIYKYNRIYSHTWFINIDSSRLSLPGCAFGDGFYAFPYSNPYKITIWPPNNHQSTLVGGFNQPLWKWWSSSVGMMTFPIYGKTCSKPPTSISGSTIPAQKKHESSLWNSEIPIFAVHPLIILITRVIAYNYNVGPPQLCLLVYKHL